MGVHAERLSALIPEVVRFYRETDAEGRCPREINTGICGFFADTLVTEYGRAYGEEPAILDEVDAFERGFAPPGLDARSMAALGLSPKALSHVWVEAAGRHFDAERPEGVVNPFDLPCLRRACAELLALDHPDTLAALSAAHPWWAHADVDARMHSAWLDDDPAALAPALEAYVALVEPWLCPSLAPEILAGRLKAEFAWPIERGELSLIEGRFRHAWNRTDGGHLIDASRRDPGAQRRVSVIERDSLTAILYRAGASAPAAEPLSGPAI